MPSMGPFGGGKGLQGEQGLSGFPGLQGPIGPQGIPGAAGSGLIAAHVLSAITSYTTNSLTLVDIDAANMAVTCTAPSSNNVLIRLGAYLDQSNVDGFGRWSLREGSSDVAGAGGSVTRVNDPGGYRMIDIILIGIANGSHTYKWSWSVSNASNSFRLLIGTGGNNQPPATMEVWSIP